MLKFAVDGKDGAPALVGLGLSFENLKRLRADAIQFRGDDLGLGAGVFVIAHEADPKLASYRRLVGTQVSELVVLTELACKQFETGIPLVTMPLTSKRKGARCEAMLFAGETEATLLEYMTTAGLVTAKTEVVAPVSVYEVSLLEKLKLAGGAVGFTIVIAMLASKPRLPGYVWLIFGGTVAWFAVTLAMRWSERVEISATAIRCHRTFGAFELAWKDLASIETRSDSLSAYELFLVTRSGERHKLRRIYARWKELVAAIMKR